MLWQRKMKKIIWVWSFVVGLRFEVFALDRALMAYVKFPMPEPCYNGREMARFWSSVIARSDCSCLGRSGCMSRENSALPNGIAVLRVYSSGRLGLWI